MSSELRRSVDHALTSIATEAHCDPSALFEEVYSALRDMAARYLGRERVDHTLQPTALVHDAYIRLMEAADLSAENIVHFRAIAARVMRQLLIEHARGKATAKRGGGRQRVSLVTDVTPAHTSPVDLLELEDALEHLARLDERMVRVVELRFFGGMTIDEVAMELGVAPTVVKDDWRMARAVLATVMDSESD
jgi:RNA polymerase sigma factor (TIGR02999 family)